MRFEIDRKAFAAALALAAKALPARPVNPVLGRVLVRADAAAGAVELVAGSAEATVGLTVPADIGEGGVTLLSKDAVACVKETRLGRVEVTCLGGLPAMNTTPAYRAKTAFDPDSHPWRWPADDRVRATVTTDAATVRRLIGATGLACGVWTEENLSAMHAAAVVLFATPDDDGGPGRLMAAATDKKVFAVAARFDGPQLAAPVPASAADLMMSFLDAGPVAVRVLAGPDGYTCGARLDGDGWWVRCPVSASRPPPFAQVLRAVSPLPNRFVADAAGLSRAVKMAALAMDRRVARMEVRVGGGRLALTGVGDDGETTADVPCDGECRPFAVAGDVLRDVTGAAAEFGGGLVELAVDAAAPDSIGVFSGDLCYAFKALARPPGGDRDGA
jgi:hypothetical protein